MPTTRKKRTRSQIPPLSPAMRFFLETGKRPGPEVFEISPKGESVRIFKCLWCNALPEIWALYGDRVMDSYTGKGKPWAAKKLLQEKKNVNK